MSEESKRVLELEPVFEWRNTHYYPTVMALAPEQADELATLAPQLARQVEALEAERKANRDLIMRVVSEMEDSACDDEGRSNNRLVIVNYDELYERVSEILGVAND